MCRRSEGTQNVLLLLRRRRRRRISSFPVHTFSFLWFANFGTPIHSHSLSLFFLLSVSPFFRGYNVFVHSFNSSVFAFFRQFYSRNADIRIRESVLLHIYQWQRKRALLMWNKLYAFFSADVWMCEHNLSKIEWIQWNDEREKDGVKRTEWHTQENSVSIKTPVFR